MTDRITKPKSRDNHWKHTCWRTCHLQQTPYQTETGRAD